MFCLAWISCCFYSSDLIKQATDSLSIFCLSTISLLSRYLDLHSSAFFMAPVRMLMFFSSSWYIRSISASILLLLVSKALNSDLAAHELCFRVERYSLILPMVISISAFDRTRPSRFYIRTPISLLIEADYTTMCPLSLLIASLCSNNIRSSSTAFFFRSSSTLKSFCRA